MPDVARFFERFFFKRASPTYPPILPSSPIFRRSLNAFQTLFTAPALSYFGIQPIETAVCFVNFPYLKACERVKDVQISQLIQNSTFKGKYNNGS